MPQTRQFTLGKASPDVKITFFCNLRHIPKDRHLDIRHSENLKSSLPEAMKRDYQPRNTSLQFLDSSNQYSLSVPIEMWG